MVGLTGVLIWGAPVKLSETVRQPNCFINRLTHWLHLERIIYNRDAPSFIEFAALTFAVFCISPVFLERKYKLLNTYVPLLIKLFEFF